jgi:hypothetical protein
MSWSRIQEFSDFPGTARAGDRSIPVGPVVEFQSQETLDSLFRFKTKP